MTLEEEARLRVQFEDATEHTMGWNNFVQEKGRYKSSIIQACWIGTKFGYKQAKALQTVEKIK